MRQYVVASNAFVFAELDRDAANFGPYLAVGVLLAQELAADRIVLPKEASRWGGLAAAITLCSVVGLIVQVAPDEITDRVVAEPMNRGVS